MKFIPTSDIIDKAKPKTELEVFGRMLRLKWFFPKLRKKKKKIALREKCPKTELFLVGIFLYSAQIQENTDQK